MSRLSERALRSARAALNGAVARRPIQTVRVRGGQLRGARLVLDLRTEKAYWRGSYERDVQELVARLVKPGDVAYDVGAHIGFFSVLLQQLAGATGMVVAFEPNPDVTARLTRNLELNQGARAIVVAEAVAGRSDQMSFQPGNSTSEGSALPPPRTFDRNDTAEAMLVQSTTIDDFVGAGHPPPALIKLDVEGLEGEVLEGAQSTLTSHHPIVLCELHAWATPKATARRLVDLGYSLTDSAGDDVSLATVGDGLAADGALRVVARR
jgi:FkbM family methyltransferase